MSSPHSPADLLRGLIARTFSTLSGDTRRAQALLRDAMPRVVSCFLTLQEQVRDHMKLITKLSTEFGAEAKTGPGLGDGMRVVIDTFVGKFTPVLVLTTEAAASRVRRVGSPSPSTPSSCWR